MWIATCTYVLFRFYYGLRSQEFHEEQAPWRYLMEYQSQGFDAKMNPTLLTNTVSLDHSSFHFDDVRLKYVIQGVSKP